jgi:hypothetical protein
MTGIRCLSSARRRLTVAPGLLWAMDCSGPGKTFPSDTGTIADLAGNAPAGVLNSSTSSVWSKGPLGPWLSLNGSATAFATFAGSPTAFDRTSQFTVETWFQPVIASACVLIGNLNSAASFRGWEQSVASATSMRWNMGNTLASNYIQISYTVPTLAVGSLYHFVTTYDGNSLASGVACYFNGALLNPTTVNQNTLTATTVSSTPMQIGSRTGTGQYSGGIGLARIWSRVLSPTQVARAYANPMAIFQRNSHY